MGLARRCNALKWLRLEPLRQRPVRVQPHHVPEVAVHVLDGDRSLADAGGDALHRTVADVAAGEDAGVREVEGLAQHHGPRQVRILARPCRITPAISPASCWLSFAMGSRGLHPRRFPICNLWKRSPKAGVPTPRACWSYGARTLAIPQRSSPTSATTGKLVFDTKFLVGEIEFDFRVKVFFVIERLCRR